MDDAQGEPVTPSRPHRRIVLFAKAATDAGNNGVRQVVEPFMSAARRLAWLAVPAAVVLAVVLVRTPVAAVLALAGTATTAWPLWRFARSIAAASANGSQSDMEQALMHWTTYARANAWMAGTLALTFLVLVVFLVIMAMMWLPSVWNHVLKAAVTGGV